MRRLLLLGLLLGALNGLVAIAALYLTHRAAPPAAYGWFSYAPLDENVVRDYYGFPWEYVAVPAVLVVLNAICLPLAVRSAGSSLR